MRPLERSTHSRTRKTIRELARTAGVTEKRMKKVLRDMDRRGEVWVNDLYVVHKSDVGNGWTELSIRRQDREPITDWRHKQQIKNQLVGEECEGLELYPAESRLVDTANQFYMWVRTEPGDRIPVGFDDGRVVSDDEPGTTRQRPLGEDGT